MAKATKQETATITLELTEEEARALWRLTYSHSNQHLDHTGRDARGVNQVYGALEDTLSPGVTPEGTISYRTR